MEKTINEQLGYAIAEAIASAPADFARKSRGKSKKRKNCVRGYPCGGTCISISKNCRKPLKGQAAFYAAWLEKHGGKAKKPMKQKQEAKDRHEITGTAAGSLEQTNPTLKALSEPTPVGKIKAPESATSNEMIRVIDELDRELGTENYLPIHHVRNVFKDFSGEEVDDLILGLERDDAIELSGVAVHDAERKAYIEKGAIMEGHMALAYIQKESLGEEAARVFRRTSTETTQKTGESKFGTPKVKVPNNPTPEQALEVITELDDKLKTKNYLPIYHVREALEHLPRERQDEILYQLEGDDRIELSTLQEGVHYTHEQIDAGIAQEIGGPIFFIMRVDD